MRSIQAACGTFATAILLFAASNAHAKWVNGEFISGGKPVQEYHCVPNGSGPHPAVVMLHGATIHKDARNPEYEKMCGELAGLGYYVEFIEYYSQTDAVGPEQPAQLREDFPKIGRAHV